MPLRLFEHDFQLRAHCRRPGCDHHRELAIGLLLRVYTPRRHAMLNVINKPGLVTPISLPPLLLTCTRGATYRTILLRATPIAVFK
jgi:hypothetical protein